MKKTLLFILSLMLLNTAQAVTSIPTKCPSTKSEASSENWEEMSQVTTFDFTQAQIRTYPKPLFAECYCLYGYIGSHGILHHQGAFSPAKDSINKWIETGKGTGTYICNDQGSSDPKVCTFTSDQ